MRVRLALTDDDTATHGAFDAASKITEELSSSKHMLCVFHAVVMRFQDLVYSLLPRKGNSKELSEKGALYGEDSLQHVMLALIQISLLCSLRRYPLTVVYEDV